jgi:hypothetical protein
MGFLSSYYRLLIDIEVSFFEPAAYSLLFAKPKARLCDKAFFCALFVPKASKRFEAILTALAIKRWYKDTFILKSYCKEYKNK